MVRPQTIPEDVTNVAKNLVTGLCVKRSQYVGFRENEWLEDAIARAIMAERERCAAFAYAKWDWPPRWIAASLRGENSAYEEFRP